MKTKFFLLPVIILITRCFCTAQPSIPDFVFTVRSGGCLNNAMEGFQFPHIKTIGMNYVHGHESFSWQYIQPYAAIWKWQWSDSIMNLVAASGMKFIPVIVTPKLSYLHFDTTVFRDDTIYIAAFKTYIDSIVTHYKNHPAWSGMMSVWGGSSDVMFDSSAQYWLDPERQVPLLNAAYDGAKSADSSTIVISFNMASPTVTKNQWEDWHNRAFLMNPKFDWFGVNTHMKKTTIHDDTLAYYSGMMGLTEIRNYLDTTGYSTRPLFVSEGGFIFGEDIGGYSETLHAEQTVTTYIIGKALPLNLKGWVYFAYFIPSHTGGDGDWGLLGACDQSDSLQPRLSWYAMKTLLTDIKFSDYDFDSLISGTSNQPQPFVYKFKHKTSPDFLLWTVFSPWWLSIDSITGKPVENPPISQSVTVNISPLQYVTMKTMTGISQTLFADSLGNVAILSTDSVIYLLGSVATGTNETVWHGKTILIYPNPFSTQTTLNSDNLFKNTTLTVFNSLGQQVKQIKNISGKEIKLQRDHLPSGIYFVRLTEENKIYTDKLLITD